MNSPKSGVVKVDPAKRSNERKRELKRLKSHAFFQRTSNASFQNLNATIRDAAIATVKEQQSLKTK